MKELSKAYQSLDGGIHATQSAALKADGDHIVAEIGEMFLLSDRSVCAMVNDFPRFLKMLAEAIRVKQQYQIALNAEE